MAKARRAPNKTERLAAVLLLIKRGGEWLVPEPVRSKGTAEQICKAVVWHHDLHFAVQAHNDPRLMTPMSKAEHDARFARDVGEISKFKRGVKARSGVAKPKRPMQYTAMKDTHKRTFGGKTVERRP